MKLTETGFDGLYILEPRVFEDARGYFMESYNKKSFQDIGIKTDWVQDNQSRSTKGVIRGLHYQLHPQAQSKLLRVLEGKIYDVVVDLRKDSPTFGKSYGVELSAENKKQFMVPAGFAHGFSVLSEHATVLYKCDCLYSPENERSIHPLDPDLNIDWKLDPEEILLSDKDKLSPQFKDAEHNF